MNRMGVLVIEASATEAALVCAALALRPEVEVVESADLRAAAGRLAKRPVVLAIAGTSALSESPDKLVKALHGVPVVGVAIGLPAAARKRALAAGVREIHERPVDWRLYSKLIDSLVARFIPADSPPRRGRTN
jgi:hypothetical protein